MRVRILNMTGDPETILYTAARTCKSGDYPSDIFRRETTGGSPEKFRLIKALWTAKHYSVFEHVSLTYAVEGVSRACLAQLSRHRHLSLSVQSQRYVNIRREESQAIPVQIPMGIYENVPEKTWDIMWRALRMMDEACEELQKEGVPLEDVRFLYPEGTMTNLVLTCNLRSLGELYEKRVATKGAQQEIRELVTELVAGLDNQLPWFKELLEVKK